MQKPVLLSIDGIRLDHFQPGREYEIGNGIAALLIAEGWAEPLIEPHAPPHPPNLIREHTSPLLELTRAASARRHPPLFH
jgi:hypothetical protein